MESRVQSQFHASNLPATQGHAARKVRWGWFSISNSLSKTNLASLLYRWYAAFRSVRAHMQFQSSTATARIDLGASLLFQDGHYVANRRTTARAEGIRKLQATHPWVDIADFRIFLMGFDAGEEYCSIDYPLRGNQEGRNDGAKSAG